MEERVGSYVGLMRRCCWPCSTAEPPRTDGETGVSATQVSESVLVTLLDEEWAQWGISKDLLDIPGDAVTVTVVVSGSGEYVERLEDSAGRRSYEKVVAGRELGMQQLRQTVMCGEAFSTVAPNNPIELVPGHTPIGRSGRLG